MNNENKNSIIILCKNIKLDREHKAVLSYTEQQMVTLCYENEIGHRNNYSFIRHGVNAIEVDFPYYECLECNYMAFQNPNMSNKWIFAFVDDIEYRNNGTTRIKYTVDNFATWFDYWNPASCYVLREHVNSDNIGEHTLPEGLETGEYIINTAGKIEADLDRCYYCLGVTYVPDNTGFTPIDSNLRVYGGIFSGLMYVVFKNEESVAKFIRAYTQMGRIDAINCLFMIPEKLTGVDYTTGNWQTASYESITGIVFAIPVLTATATVLRNDISITSPSQINGYTPKNNKCFVFPYNFLSISNNAGTQVEFNYEDFVNNTATFQLEGVLTPSGAIKLFPLNYKKYSDNNYRKATYNWGISCAKYPMGSWQNDLYTNWETVNGINIFGKRLTASESRYIGGVAQTAIGVAQVGFGLQSGNGTESSGGNNIGGGLGNIFAAVQEMYRHSMDSPALEGQIGAGDIQYASREMSPTYYKMTVKREYIEIIDNFFSRFGYKINRIKTPNITGRQYFNFVQIGGSEDIVNSVNGIPALAIDEINNMFRNGITIWHDHTNIGNFSLNNTIVS